jgi:hypothetical protein
MAYHIPQFVEKAQIGTGMVVVNEAQVLLNRWRKQVLAARNVIEQRGHTLDVGNLG